MRATTVQLHILPKETLEFATQAMDEHALKAACIHFFPYRVRLCQDSRALRRALGANCSQPNQVWLARRVFKSVDGDLSTFEDANPEVINILLGDRGRRTLRETLISGYANKESTLALWKQIIGPLRRSCHRGLWLANNDLRIKGFYKTAPYTEGVKKAVSRGLSLLPLIGENTLSVEEPFF